MDSFSACILWQPWIVDQLLFHGNQGQLLS